MAPTVDDSRDDSKELTNSSEQPKERLSANIAKYTSRPNMITRSEKCLYVVLIMTSYAIK
jgi:hypothetical protein